MKKYIPISFMAVFIIFASGSIAAPTDKEAKLFNCRLINIADDYIEVKKGKTELYLYASEDSKYITKEGAEAGKDILEICQYVNVYYNTVENKNILSKIVITKESDCIK